MQGLAEILPVVAGPVLGMLGAWGVAWLSLRSRRAEESTKLAAIRDQAISSTFDMVTRSRDDSFAQVEKERVRREALESRVTGLDRQRAKAEAEVELLKRLQCPLAVSGQCPVFRAPATV